jgi:hypothetical protein
MGKRLGAVVALLVLGAAAGCGSGGGEGDPVPDADLPEVGAEVTEAGPDAAEVAEDPFRRLVRVTCEKLAACAAASLKIYIGDVPTCLASEYETMKMLPDLPGLGIDVEGSADAVEANSCSEFTRSTAMESRPFGIVGSLADGKPCVHPLQCSGHVCARPEGTSCGTCASPLPAGAPCDGNHLVGSPCGFGSTCAGGNCVALGDTGAQCDPATAPCFSDLGCIDGTCGPPKQVDEPCSSLVGECDLYDSGLVCHPAAGKCIAFTYAGPDEPCGVTETGGTVCTGSDCFPNALAGNCMARAADGAKCDPEVGPYCQFHAHCVNGSCEQFFTPVCK